MWNIDKQNLWQIATIHLVLLKREVKEILKEIE
ncbi:hypothetical protein C5S39_14095 [Candidatus Methanophagaceae archaeon]|nr:hypothetical protein C5S39_14095 [Methanophagales archaeon]